LNRAELRRFVLVALPCALLIALAASAAITLPGASPAVAPGPAIGSHWHAPYQVWVCGERQPDIPAFEGGVRTDADGIIHIHPFRASEEGAGARLVKFFEYAGGLLTQTEMRMPGSTHTFRNGDRCPDGSTGALGVRVNGSPLSSWTEYIPADGDRIVITFGAAP